MKRNPTRSLAALVCLTLTFVSAPAAARPAPPSAAAPAAPRPDGGARAAEAFAALPMAFEPNVGQTDARARFVARGRGYAVFLTDDGPTLTLGQGWLDGPTKTDRAVAPRRSDAVAVRLVGARSSSRVAGERALPGKSNYLGGSDPARWHRDVPTYAAVRYANVYAGVDAVVYGTDRKLEYDFVVAPGADPGQIRLRFEGQRDARVDENGDLVLKLGSGEIRQHRAAVFQEGAAGKQAVSARYVLGTGGEVGFELGEYDHVRPLVVDPLIDYTAYLGGGVSSDAVKAVAVDADGAVYVAGTTDAIDFPVTPGAFDTVGHTEQPYYFGTQDAFVAKLSADASSILYATYLGGTGTDDALAIAVDGAGNAYVAGVTHSLDFPTTPGAFDTDDDQTYYNGDAFVAKVNAAGSSLAYSTFLGGIDVDRPAAITVGPGGSVYVVGTTESYDFPTTAGAFDPTFNSVDGSDVFVTALDATGSALVASSFLGGYGNEGATGVAIDGSGAVYVTGGTSSAPDFPVTPGAYDTTGDTNSYSDAFVTKFAPGLASLAYSTFLGGSSSDSPNGLVVDASGAAYVVGTTSSMDYPVTDGAIDHTPMYYGTDVFLTKFDASGASLAYSARIGGDDQDGAVAVAVDGAGVATVLGTTYSEDFPTTMGAFDTTIEGTEAFVAKVNATGSDFVYSTFLGGSSSDSPNGLVVDASGAAYVVGTTSSLDFPTTPDTVGPRFGGFYDGFVTKLDAAGDLEYSTLLSGTASTSSTADDEARGVAVDASGSAYVVGRTTALNFPTTLGAYDATGTQPSYYAYGEVFVTKLNADGDALVYSTFLGGTSDEYATAVAVDASGAAYVTGVTFSMDFPTTPGAFDTTPSMDVYYQQEAFLTKLSADGSTLAYSTYLGGDSIDVGTALAVDSSGAAYVAGNTSSTDFPTTPGAYDTTYNGYNRDDAFVTKVNATGSALVYSTYLGGGGDESCNAIAVDASGAAYVAGDTSSPAFPTTPGAFDRTFHSYNTYQGTDGFVAKLAPSGTSLVYSTFLGGNYVDTILGIAVDSAGSAYAVGQTGSSDFPTTPGAFDPAPGNIGGYEGFVTKLNPEGSALVYSTFLRGFGDDWCTGVRVDPTGRAYVTGQTQSSNFPTTPGANDEVINGGSYYYPVDAFITVVGAAGDTLAYSTFLGGSFDDFGNAIAIDASGSAYVVGRTTSPDFPASGFGSRDQTTAFVARIAPVAAPNADTPGIYVVDSSGWFLRNRNASGDAEVIFGYGPSNSGWLPIAGDWNGDGVDTPGLFNPATGTFYLKNTASGGYADLTFGFGAGGAGVTPLAGDWNGDGTDTIGFYVADTSTFFLKNSNEGGAADVVFSYGAGGTGLVPLSGDWNGDGVDTIGLYNPETGAFFLKNTNSAGGADLVFFFGAGFATPLAGDWNGDGVDTIGLYDYYSGSWLLKNTNASGPADRVFGFGPGYVTPVVGNWDGM